MGDSDVVYYGATGAHGLRRNKAPSSFLAPSTSLIKFNDYGKSSPGLSDVIKSLRLSVLWIMVPAPGEDSHIKVTGMLVVSLRGVNCRHWSHCVWDGTSLYLLIQVSLSAVY